MSKIRVASTYILENKVCFIYTTKVTNTYQSTYQNLVQLVLQDYRKQRNSKCSKL
jgi:hypothetical protein